MSQSLELNQNLVQRALGTFSISIQFKSLNSREQGSVISSQASLITDYAQITDVNQNERLKKNKDQSKRESTKFVSFRIWTQNPQMMQTNH